MTCQQGPGITHYAACDCREADIEARLSYYQNRAVDSEGRIADLARKLAEAEAKAEKYREELALIDGECRMSEVPCFDKMPTGRAFWCKSCIARTALAPKEETNG